MNDVLEFHDSTVLGVATPDSSVVVDFDPAMIHRASGEPGIDDGDVLLQRVRLVFRNAHATGSFVDCKGWLSDGSIYLPSDTLSLVPVPHLHNGSVRAKLVFVNGEVLSIEGQGFDCSPLGNATFLQKFIK